MAWLSAHGSASLRIPVRARPRHPMLLEGERRYRILDKTVDVVIIGGGVTGSSCAYHLARAGVKVTLLEKQEIASGASGGSAGGVRQQNREDVELPLAMHANPMWKMLEQDLGCDVEYRRGGNLHLIEREEQLPALENRVNEQRAHGLDTRLVQGAELRELAPALGPQVLAGAYCAGDGYANPILTTKALAAAASREGAGVLTGTHVTAILRTGNRVEGVETSRGKIASRWVINAAGAWARRLSVTIGIVLPFSPRAHQMMVTEKAPAMLTPVLGCTGRELSLKQMPQGQLVIGGGWPGYADLETDNGWPRRGCPNGNARHVVDILPATAELGIVRVWNSLEAWCIDGVPVLGTVDGVEGYIVAAGFSGHGFALAPSVGTLMTDLVTTGRTSVPLDGLNLRRFDNLSPERLQEYDREMRWLSWPPVD